MASALSWGLILLCAVLTAAANLLLRGGALQAGGLPSDLGTVPGAMLRLLANPGFVAGVVLYGLAALVWIKVLSDEPITLAYPLLVSITFVLVTVGGVFFFKEQMGLVRLLGMAVIILGILLVGRG